MIAGFAYAPLDACYRLFDTFAVGGGSPEISDAAHLIPWILNVSLILGIGAGV